MKSFTRLISITLGVLGILGTSLGLAQAQEDEPAIVTVFHAVPADDGFPADVYLDGELIIDGFVFETSSDSFEIGAGSASIEIFTDGSDPDTDPPAVSAPVTFEAGVNYSVVAQLANGSPVITIFENDTDGVGPGESRVTLRQTSSLPTLDARIGGANSFTAVAQTEEASAVVPSGAVSLELTTSAGETIFSDDIDVADGVLTVVYTVGDPADGTFDLLVQEVLISQVSPTGVPAGDGGLKSDPGLTSSGAALVTLLLGAGWVVQRRRA